MSTRQHDRPAVRCQCKSGIFLGKWHKKVAGRRGKHFRLVPSITVQAAGSSAKIRFHRQPSGWLPRLHGSRDRNVEPIVVLCIQRPAAGPLSRRRSFATSLPGGRSARTRWSGPRGCRAGSGPATFRAWSPADRRRLHAASRRPAGDGAGAMAAVPLSIDLGIWSSRGEPGARGRLILRHSGAMGCDLVLYAGSSPRVQRAGTAEPRLHGQAMTIVPWFFGFVVLMIGVDLIGSQLLSNLMIPVQIASVLDGSEMVRRQSRSNGQPLRLAFDGSVWAYVGWGILAVISFITIVGWAWVYVPGCAGFAATSGHAARSRLHRQRPGVPVASDRGCDRLRLHHPDSVGVSLDVAVAGVADRFG